MRETRVHGPGLVGAIEHLVEALVHDDGQALAAIGRIGRERRPAAFHVLGECGLEAGGRGDLVGLAIEAAALGVAADVQRKDHLAGELATFFEDRVDGVSIDILVARHGAVVVGDVQYFMHHELHVTQRRGVGGHGSKGS